MISYNDIKNNLSKYYGAKYRYLYTYSFLLGGLPDQTRIDAKLGQVLEHESAANDKNNKEADYLEKYQIEEITNKKNQLESSTNDDLYKVALLNYNKPDKSIIKFNGILGKNNHYNHISVYRTTNMIAEDANFGTVNDNYLYCKDIPMAKIVSVIGGNSFLGYIVLKDKPLTDNDIGNILSNRDGSKKIKIISMYDIGNTSNQYVWIEQLEGSAPTNNEIFFFGAKKVYCLEREELEDGSIQYTSAYAQFQKTDEGQNLNFKDGTIAVIVRYVNSSIVIVKEITAFLDTPVFDYFFAWKGFEGRLFYDNISDDVLKGRRDSGEPLYFLQTRFHEPVPNSNIGEITSGFLFVGNPIKNEYYYTQLANIYRSGCYHPAFQYNDLFKAALTRITEYPNKILIIWGENHTYYVDTNLIDNAGEALLGEFVPVLPDPELITDGIGCPNKNSAAKVADGAEFIFTSEPAIRVFNGKSYTEDLTQGRVFNSYLAKLKQSVVIHWSKLLGLKIKGIK